LKADKPEVSPGSTVTVTPFVSDINGAGRVLSYQAEGCTDPGLARGVDPSCDTASDRVVIASGTINATNSPAFVSPNYSGAVAAVTFTVPTTILDGKTSLEQMIGVDYIVMYRLETSDGEVLKSIKRITATTKTTLNANPTLSSFQKEGADLTALPSAAVNLTPKFGANSAETYSAIRSDGTPITVTETMIVTWFISDGTIDFTRTVDTSENTYTPPATKPTTRSVVLIGVIRDGRGGEDVLRLEL
jgi:hypothetical protein